MGIRMGQNGPEWDQNVLVHSDCILMHSDAVMSECFKKGQNGVHSECLHLLVNSSVGHGRGTVMQDIHRRGSRDILGLWSGTGISELETTFLIRMGGPF